jgi:hypothetical protein
VANNPGDPQPPGVLVAHGEAEGGQAPHGEAHRVHPPGIVGRQVVQPGEQGPHRALTGLAGEVGVGQAVGRDEHPTPARAFSGQVRLEEHLAFAAAEAVEGDHQGTRPGTRLELGQLDQGPLGTGRVPRGGGGQQHLVGGRARPARDLPVGQVARPGPAPIVEPRGAGDLGLGGPTEGRVGGDLVGGDLVGGDLVGLLNGNEDEQQGRQHPGSIGCPRPGAGVRIPSRARAGPGPPRSAGHGR